jgi:hypothetical protein
MSNADTHEAEPRAGLKTVLITLGIFAVCALIGGLLSGKLF